MADSLTLGIFYVLHLDRYRCRNRLAAEMFPPSAAGQVVQDLSASRSILFRLQGRLGKHDRLLIANHDALLGDLLQQRHAIAEGVVTDKHRQQP